VSGVNAFEESDRAARARLEEEFARQIARGLELAGEVERLEAEVEQVTKERDHAQAGYANLGTIGLAKQAEINELEAEVERLTAALNQADMALGYITEDGINRLTEDSPMLLIDVRKLDGVVGILRAALAKETTKEHMHGGTCRCNPVPRAALAKEEEVSQQTGT
jgi:seryl-tRNA synthetase